MSTHRQDDAMARVQQRNIGLGAVLFMGTRKDLIAAGVCEASWFPRPKERVGRGRRLKRTFRRYTADGRLVVLHDEGRRWAVCVGPTEKERARRAAAEESARAKAEAEESLAVRRALQRTPAPRREDVTADELEHLRVLRTLSAETRQFVWEFAFQVLGVDARHGMLAGAPRASLQLVVDNESGGGP